MAGGTSGGGGGGGGGTGNVKGGDAGNYGAATGCFGNQVRWQGVVIVTYNAGLIIPSAWAVSVS
jgi:hypothetical protein